MTDEEIKEILDELNTVRPEKLNKEAKRLFDAIMKIADDKDKAESDLYEANNRINELKEINKEIGEALDEWNNGERTSIFHVHKDKIKAKIGERMQKNNNIIHNAKLKYGKDYVYYDDVQKAKEENRICKEILESLLEKE